jgi:hypothetical protein
MASNRIRILMIHGFAQNAKLFEIKTRPLVAVIRNVLSEHYDVDPDQIMFIFANAPIVLDPNDLIKSSSFISDYTTPTNSHSDTVDMRSWWHFAGNDSQYIGLEGSLQYLKDLTQSAGPFNAVIGFSIGGILASVFTSWCEASTSPTRAQALSHISEPHLVQLLSTPPQAQPVDFFATFCSFVASPEYYGQFYEPRLTTPSVHCGGELDILIPMRGAMEITERCENAIVMGFMGGHFVPRSREVLETWAENVRLVLHRNKAIGSMATMVTDSVETRGRWDKDEMAVAISEVSSRSSSSARTTSTMSSSRSKVFYRTRGGVRVRAR